MRSYIPKDARLIPENATKVYDGKIFKVYEWPQKMFDGRIETFEMLRREDTVVIFAIKDDKLVIERQRQPDTDWFYSFPGGRHENEEETELEAAKRELKEETGLSFKNWKLISAEQRESKEDRIIYTFVATDFESETEQSLDQGGEEIEVLEVTLEELKAMKGRPDAKHLHLERFDEINSIKDLQNLPSLV
ncbi:NUDIX domain-containing protein [Candidatus Saccharibacteria bacterium]|nr:NUDIX domain-containing protein [Candidatus Saccharibacteria bacterium]MBQ9017137.1 NUDIX domain-containing protein [Candidatus Saccharibacteria bacterium]